MKKIKIKHMGYWSGFIPRQDPIYGILQKYYEVETSDDPDYLIIGPFAKPSDYCGTRQVRIMFSEENYIPDFNVIDYAISPYPIRFGDRHHSRPVCMEPAFNWLSLQNKDRNYSADILKEKLFFANFIASHDSEYGYRSEFYRKLSEYKRIESAGSFLNNMEGGEKVQWLDGTKFSLQKKCKFTMCFESTNHFGFVTEKITDAFRTDTIPVYYGSPTVSEIFNPRAFINCGDYPTWEAAIERIIELDQDDEKYLAMLREPILNDPALPERSQEEFEQFIRHIFDQPLETAYRRSRVYAAKKSDDYLTHARLIHEFSAKEMISGVCRRIGRKILRKNA